jgi:hypothetical protein
LFVRPGCTPEPGGEVPANCVECKLAQVDQDHLRDEDEDEDEDEDGDEDEDEDEEEDGRGIW